MSDSPDPILQAARIILRTARDDMRADIEGLPPEAINWAPRGEDTNSIAVIAHHAWHSTRTWLAIAVGEEPPERDRDSEFEVEYEGAEALLAMIEDLSEQCLGLISRERRVDWGELRKHWDGTQDIQLSAAWALLHPIEHLREHVGHIGLTRQIWEAQAALSHHQ